MKPLVLIVDDEVAIVRVLKDKLEAEGFETLTAYDGCKAVELAVKELPDLILMDITMPNMNGLEAAKLIRNNPKSSHIPIFMLTARGQDSDEQAGYEVGAIRYFTKPFSTRRLVQEIRQILSERNENSKK